MDAPPRLLKALGSLYDLVREIGQGGMAVVYLARDRNSGEEVAIKVLDPELVSALGPARFLREIRIAQSLEHPRVLSVLDSGDADGFLYYVMPYVRGPSLRQRLDEVGPLALDDALVLVDQVAEALDHAHASGVVHRDIKPENILLAASGAVVADFGIARVVHPGESDRVTATGHAVGTAAYASPEQASGASRFDARTDVYSLACVLFEMLAGEPPFTGPTAQAVMARHMAQPPPSLDVVRPGLPPAVVAAITRALSKVPADRFDSAGAFSRALRAPGAVLTRAQRRRRLRRSVGVAVVALACGGVLWQFLPRSPPLDANKVVVFPLATTNAIGDPSAGWDVALTIGAALEHAEPLRSIDGWTWLDENQRADPEIVTAALARRIATERGAAFTMSGVVRESQGQLAVVLRLTDVAGDSLVVQETAEGPGSSTTLPGLALEALLGVLPRLIDPSRPVDLSPLTDRTSAATALFLQGERAYRRSHFDEALGLYRRAVAEDSLFAFAAVKGAQAAGWASDFGQAEALLTQALAHAASLPRKYERFARGLEAFVHGHADAAASSLGEALELDPEWVEASAALGEVYYHLLPRSVDDPDSVARSLFARAWSLDSTFAPPLFHLTEIALRDGHVREAEELVGRWRRFEPDTFFLRQVEYSLDCLEAGPGDFDWAPRLGASGRSVLQAAMSLSGRGAQLGCAEPAFRAVLGADLPRSVRWTAYKGLFGIAMARGDYARVDSLFAQRSPDLGVARVLYVYAALAGGPFGVEADQAERSLRAASGVLYRNDDGVQPPRYRWLLGVWLTKRGELDRVERLVEDMKRHAEAEDSRREGLLARALAGHLAAARGDTAGAISLLESLAPDVPHNDLAFDEWESLAPERLLLSELLLADNPGKAYQVASLLDHPVPQIYLAFLPASLAIRREAAMRMGREELAEEATARLRTLGWTDPDRVPPVPH